MSRRSVIARSYTPMRPVRSACVAGLSTPIVFVVFVRASGATWIAVMSLSSTTDELDNRLGLGAALGGMILLAIAGSLPEIAITVTATAQGHLGLAAGNLIGG